MDKVKNFDEFYVNPIMEGLFQHAEWVDMDLLQGTIERMRSEEYKGALANLNQQYPLDSGNSGQRSQPDKKIHSKSIYYNSPGSGASRVYHPGW